MIRKYLILALLGIGSVLSAEAFSLSITVNGNTMTNVIFPLPQGSGLVKSISVANNNGALGTSVQFVDTYTNSLSYTNPPYTNFISYATNRIYFSTNYYGVATQQTNLALIDATNAVGITTNTFPTRATISALAGTTTTFNNQNIYFGNGIWVTNLTASNAVVTVTGVFGE